MPASAAAAQSLVSYATRAVRFAVTDSQNFVYGQFLGSEKLETRTLIDGEEACVTPKVDLGPAVFAHHEEPDEAGAIQHPLDGEAAIL